MGLTILYFFLLAVCSYMFGNIHFARLLSHARKDDITTHGSGNPGSMNMLRTHGMILGIVTLLLDAAKGAIPALVGFYVFGGAGGGLPAVYAMHIAGFFAVVGHIFPVIYKFKGGKGVATSLGFFTVVNPLVSAIMFGVGLLVFIFTKIGSVTSLVYIAGFFIIQIAMNFELSYVFPACLLFATAVLVFFFHKSNMKKLVHNQENKINFNQVLEKDKQLISDSKEHIKQLKNKK